ncbi:alpha-hydroxy acid oxidase [Subtercola lobariae]|uniref:Alpha-hydroxy-acid oxidizing enzyme n=1 Tax=Subtercola lobariae TaxID=1588641 RepID=A0A917B0G3_9MICO|nr:alpha-hydroxy acid oxidase [Subtercola lobariae]GGF11835.1 alpha-hydroxy-acid oxidizing enzyme [Subtercola lobariae]
MSSQQAVSDARQAVPDATRFGPLAESAADAETKAAAVAAARTFVSVAEFEQAAEALWAPGPRAFIQEGAGSGRSIAANLAAHTRWALRSRVLVDVSHIDTTTTVLGHEISMPIIVGPSGLHNLSHTEAEVGTAIGARDADTVMVLSAGSSQSMEDVRAVGGTTWFQMYWGADRERTARLIANAEATGCSALCITVDLPVRPLLGPSMIAGVQSVAAERPMYVMPRGAHLAGGAWDHDASLTWNDLAWLREQTTLPLILKGIMTGEDAALAAEHGVEAVIVSNHGGRSLDTPRGTLDALPEVVAATVGTATEVYVDGGFRHGAEVVVALSLGARAVLLGRPVVWGLAAGGSAGLASLLELYRRQLVSTMGTIGTPTIAAISRSCITESTVRS